MVTRQTSQWVLCFVLLTLHSPSCASGNEYADVPSEEGSGSDDEDLSGLFSDVIQHDVIVRCYVCTGDGHESGCNVTLLRHNPESYLADCNGHCINLTAGRNTIFSCTEKVSVKKTLCFHREEMTMCACGSDLCNGPSPYTHPDTVDLPDSQRGISLVSQHEVNVVLPRTLRHRQNNENSTVADKSEGCRAILGSCVFFLVKLWWGFNVLKDYV